jgi:hypothetical protein
VFRGVLHPGAGTSSGAGAVWWDRTQRGSASATRGRPVPVSTESAGRGCGTSSRPAGRCSSGRPADPPERPDEALLLLGDDSTGQLIEEVGLEMDDATPDRPRNGRAPRVPSAVRGGEADKTRGRRTADIRVRTRTPTRGRGRLRHRRPATATSRPSVPGRMCRTVSVVSTSGSTTTPWTPCKARPASGPSSQRPRPGRSTATPTRARQVPSQQRCARRWQRLLSPHGASAQRLRSPPAQSELYGTSSKRLRTT